MVVILVALTFLVFVIVGAYMEYGTKKVSEKQVSPVISVNPVFAQDGGEKLESENKKGNKEK